MAINPPGFFVVRIYFLDRFQNSVDNCFMAAVLFLYIYVEEERKEKGKRKRNSWIRGKIIHICVSFLYVRKIFAKR